MNNFWWTLNPPSPACDGVKRAKLQAAVPNDAADRHTETRVQGEESTWLCR